MAFNWSSLLSFVKHNPALVLAIGSPLIKAAVTDPSIISDAVGLTKGGNVGAFVEKHSGAVAGVAGAALAAVEANPQLITDVLAAFSAPAPTPITAASGSGG
jgi:hypothetical protein